MSTRMPQSSRSAASGEELSRQVRLHIPANPAAERAVLGAIFADGNCFYRIVDIVGSDDFYEPSHRSVFQAMAALATDSRDIDLLTVSDQLSRGGELDSVGGMGQLATLAQDLPDPANVEHYAEIVRERSVKRQLLGVSQELLAFCGRDEGTGMEALDRAEARILAISEKALRGGPRAVSEIVHAEVDHIERVSSSSAPFTGVETGFFRLDELTSGLQKQDLIILAARPGVGKTAMALNIAAHVALRKQLKVAIFSLEMSSSALVRRLLAAEARINLKRLSRGLLSRGAERQGGGRGPSDWQLLTEAADRLADGQLWIDDAPGISVLELRGKCRRMMLEHGLDLVVVDYLQLMTAGIDAENRTQEVSAISRGLKAIAKQLDVPMLVLSQLSRRPEQRGGDQRPQLSDLRESGSIEQDADVVLFISRRNRALASVASEADEDDLRLAEVIVAKQRNGPTDLFKLVYLDEFTRFENPDFSHG